MSKIFGFFSKTENKKDTGPTKDETQKIKNLNFFNFFKILKKSFGKLTTANLLFVFCNFALLFFIIGSSGIFDNHVNAPVNNMYPQFYALSLSGKSPVYAALFPLIGISSEMSVLSAASRVFLYLSLFLLATFGFTNAGIAYIARGAARGDHITAGADFFGTIKKNFKQALIFGIIDCALIFFLFFDYVSYKANTGEFVINIFYFAVIIFIIIYFIMRFYIYTIMITFDLPLKKIIKNAFLLTVLGFKRNIAALLSCFAVIYLSVIIYIFLPTVGILLPFIFTFGLIYFIGIYCIYPVIDKYMVKPYYKDNPEPEPDDIEPVFVDRG